MPYAWDNKELLQTGYRQRDVKRKGHHLAGGVGGGNLYEIILAETVSVNVKLESSMISFESKAMARRHREARGGDKNGYSNTGASLCSMTQ